jgi:hypothetical protein
MKTNLWGAAFAAALAAAANSAGATELDVHKLIINITADDLKSAAEAVAFTAEIATDASGNRAVVVTSSNKIKFTAQPDLCQKPQQGACHAFSLFALFDGGHVTTDQINAFNVSNAISKAYLDKGQAVLTRFETFDYGIPGGNVATNMSDFAAAAESFSAIARPAPPPPPPKPKG